MLGGAYTSVSGNSLSVTLRLTFSASFGGTKSIYLMACDTTACSNWVVGGAWGIPTSPVPPLPVSVSPNSGSDNTKTFYFDFSGVNGYTDVNQMYMFFNSAFSGSNACYLSY